MNQVLYADIYLGSSHSLKPEILSLIFFASFKHIIALNFSWKVLWSYFKQALY